MINTYPLAAATALAVLAAGPTSASAPVLPPPGALLIELVPQDSSAQDTLAQRVGPIAVRLASQAQKPAPVPCLACWGPPVTNGAALNPVQSAPAATTPAAPPRSSGGGYINNGPQLNNEFVLADFTHEPLIELAPQDLPAQDTLAQRVRPVAARLASHARKPAPVPCVGCDWGPPMTNGAALNPVQTAPAASAPAQPTRPPGGGGFVNNGPQLNNEFVLTDISHQPAIARGKPVPDNRRPRSGDR